jgi:hypothetical protein
VSARPSRGGARSLAACALIAGLAALLASCATGPHAATAPAAAETAAARAAYDRARRAAYAPRRFKALFSGEVAPKVGAIARGYLSVWWDGKTLVWRASAPLAGAGNLGRLALDEPLAGRVPFPGEIDARDAIGLLLGVLDVAPAGPVERARGGFRVGLDDHGRAARLDETYRIVGLELPRGARASYEPGEAIPRRIDAKSPDGTALLRLSSFGDWPASEPIP